MCKCTVPMFSGDGSPDGFCGKPAYGKRPDCPEYFSYATMRYERIDGRYNGYAPGIVCPAHGGPTKEEVERLSR